MTHRIQIESPDDTGRWLNTGDSFEVDCDPEDLPHHARLALSEAICFEGFRGGPLRAVIIPSEEGYPMQTIMGTGPEADPRLNEYIAREEERQSERAMS